MASVNKNLVWTQLCDECFHVLTLPIPTSPRQLNARDVTLCKDSTSLLKESYKLIPVPHEPWNDVFLLQTELEIPLCKVD